MSIQIVGGGLIGSLLSIYLAKRNFNIELYEGRPDPRERMQSENRSINLAISARGLKALKEVGLLDEALKLAIPMKGRMLHTTDGKTTLVAYGQKSDEVIYSIGRNDLNKLLLEKAASFPNVKMHFRHRCIRYNVAESTLQFKTPHSTALTTTHTACVFGTDGARSVLRQSLKQVSNGIQTETFLEYGYKELHIPAANHHQFQMEKQALHIWPRKNFMLIALPNLDGSFTATLFLPHKGNCSFATLTTPAEVMNFFENNFPDATAIMPNLTQQFFAHPVGTMVTVKSFPWYIEDKMMLLGDAAHAIVPFFGQGMNCGFEDCSELANLIDHHPTLDWKTLFAKLEEKRKTNTDAIADMALENFIEMRDTVADAKFQLKKQIGFELEKRFPEKFIPRYSMVVFHPEISYRRAQYQSYIQDKLLDELCNYIQTIDQVDWQHAKKLLEEAEKIKQRPEISLHQVGYFSPSHFSKTRQEKQEPTQIQIQSKL